jgi:cytochrome P450
MIQCSQCIVRSHDKGNIVDFFPWARPLLRSSLMALDKLCVTMLAATRRMTALHRASHRDGVIRDVIDALIEAADGTEAGRKLGADRVEMTVQEFIGAGVDILAASALWLVAYMAEHPDVQERVRREADAAALVSAEGDLFADGRSRTQGQRATMTPYAEAVVLEVLRHSCVVPVALPHATLGDMHISGTFFLTTLGYPPPPHSVMRSCRTLFTYYFHTMIKSFQFAARASDIMNPMYPVVVRMISAASE